MRQIVEIEFRPRSVDRDPGAELVQAMRDEMRELYSGLELDSEEMPKAGSTRIYLR